MSPNQVQLIIAAVNQFGPAFSQLGTALGSARGQVAVLAGEFTALHYAGKRVFEALNATVFEFSSTLETATLGIASAFMTSGQYIDQTTGKALQGQAALVAAQGDAKKVMEELQVANFETIATLDQLVRAYQETLPVAMAKGFDRTQVKDFTVAMVQAAGAIGLSMDQLGEETRSLLTGSINPRTSRIATVLGLTNADIAEFKGNADGLFAFLMKKLDAYRVAGVESQKTWQGLLSNTADILKQSAAKAFEPLFEGSKKALSELTSSLVSIDAETKTITWNPEFLSGAEHVRDRLTATLGVLKEVGAELIEHRNLVLAMIEVYVGLKVSVLAYETLARIGAGGTGMYERAAAVWAERAAILAKAQADETAAAASAATAAAETNASGAAWLHAQAEAGAAEMVSLHTARILAQTEALAASTVALSGMAAAGFVSESAMADAGSAAAGLAATQTQAAAAAARLAAAEAAVAVTETALFSAEARATEASVAHAAAAQALATTMAEQSIASIGWQSVLGALGGPLGILITLLGTAATAWWVFGNKAEEAGNKAEQAGKKVLDELREQHRLLRERLRIQKELSEQKGGPAPASDEQLKEVRRLEAERDRIQTRLKGIPEQSFDFTAGARERAALESELWGVNQRLLGIDALRRRNAEDERKLAHYEQRAPEDKPKKEKKPSEHDQNQEMIGANAEFFQQWNPDRVLEMESRNAAGKDKEALSEALALMKDFGDTILDIEAAEKETSDKIRDALSASQELRFRETAGLMKDLGQPDSLADILAAEKEASDKIRAALASSQELRFQETAGLMKDLGQPDSLADVLAAEKEASDKIRAALVSSQELRFQETAALMRDFGDTVADVEAGKALEGISREGSRGWLSGAKGALQDYLAAVRDTFAQAEAVVSATLSSLEDTIVDVFRTGKLSAKDFADTVIAELARIAVRQSITGPLAQALGNYLGNLGGGTKAPIEPPTTTNLGSGGGVTYAPRQAMTLTWPAPEGVSAGRSAGRAVGGAAAAGAAASPTVEVHVHADGNAKPRVEETSTPNGGKRIDVWLDELVAGNVGRGGRTAAAFERVYGLRRVGV
jgi:lambda family phage tail tape measure protein